MFSLRLLCAALALILVVSRPSPVVAGVMLTSIATEQPTGQGDQLVFYYDARESFTSFLTVRNAGAQSSPTRTVRVVFYSGGFSLPFSRDIELVPGQVRILDVGALRADGLPAQPGLAVAIAIDSSGAPIVTRALTGNFTVANGATGSGWGAPAAARSAITATAEATSAVAPPGTLPATGTVIDGTLVALRPVQPRELDLAAYYAPNDLAPPEDGGNQLIFLSFVDVLGTPYAAQPAATSWKLIARRSDGTLVADTTYGVSGVEVTDLASVVGPAVVDSGGSIRFSADQTAERISRFVFFAEALGTIGTGYMLPTPGIASMSMTIAER